MNIFGWRKNLSISQEHPTFKVRYLGNVQTAVMKGDGCVDKATNVIWNNYLRSSEHHASSGGIDMKMELTGAGMKAYTKEQGLTEYLAHRISYCIAHPDFPKLFVWVYRHEGRKMKMELRCHAVLCKSVSKAKTMALQLREKLSFALADFKREKVHKQNSRLVLQRTNSFPKSGSVLPLRTQLLSTAKNFRPNNPKAQSLLKLGAIQEDAEEHEDEYGEEEEQEEGEEEEEGIVEEEDEEVLVKKLRNLNSCRQRRESAPNASPLSAGPSATGLVHKGVEHHDILEALNLEAADDYGVDLFGTAQPIIDLEFGNDLEELRRDSGVRYCLGGEGMDSDEESAESGFHDQENGSFPDTDNGAADAADSSTLKTATGASGATLRGDVGGVERRHVAEEMEEVKEEAECDQTVYVLPISGDEAEPSSSTICKTAL